jgi:hypothetical protein
MDLKMYNNRNYKMSQKSFQEGFENIKNYLSEVGKNIQSLGKSGIESGEDFANKIPEIVEDLKQGNLDKVKPDIHKLMEMGVDVGKEFAPYILGDITALKTLGSMGIKIPHSGGLLKNLGMGAAGLLGAEGAMAIAEQAKGDLAIYEDYMSDYMKDLDAIKNLYPNNEDLDSLIKLLKKIANEGLEEIKNAKNKQVVTMRKNYKLAIVGDANWGSYGHQFLSGAGMGAATSKSWQGALAGGLGMSLADIGKDIFHNMQSDEYKAAAYSNELKNKASTMFLQLKKYNPQKAISLKTWVENFDVYVRKNIYKEENLEDPKIINIYLNMRKGKK